jgi:energy-coupling factor transport system substrate-specific component
LKSPLPSAGSAKITLREILLFGLFGAILIIVQVALAILPNIELVSLLIIVYTLVLGKKVFFPICVFVIGEGLIFGFGLWWINYLYIWAMLAAAVLLLRNNEHPLFWAIVSGIFGLLFGALSAIPYLFIGGIGAAVAYWVNGIIFDLLHCAGNAVAAALLFTPSYKIMKRLYLNE